MKHLFKKGLSLLLAVLMVTSALPMNVLAASVAESRKEAVADVGDIYSTGEDTRPPQQEDPDEIGDDTGGVKDDAEDPAGEPEDAARPETPVDDGANGESAAKKEQTEKPDADVGDDDPPVDPFWSNWDMEFISIDPDTGDFVIKITGGSKANSGQFGLTVLPRMRSSSNPAYKVPDEVTQVTGSTVGPALQTTLATRTGLSTAVMWHTDHSTYGTITLDDNGEAIITGSFGMSNGELAALLGGAVDVKGNKVNADAIPIVAVLTTQAGDAVGVDYAYKTMGGAAVLRVDPDKPSINKQPDTIVLAESATSFQFDVQHTSVSTENATIQNIKWVGTNTAYVGNGSGTASNETGTVALIENNLDGSRKTIHVSLSGNANQRGPYLGDVIIEYNSASLQRMRTLVVHVTTGETPPIEITVVRGGGAKSGSGTLSTADAAVPVAPKVIEGLTGEAGATTEAVDSNGDDNITLTMIEDGIYADLTEIYQWDEDAGDFVYDADGMPVLQPGFSWVASGGSLGDLVSAEASEDAELGTYTAGYVQINYMTEMSEFGVLHIPVIVTVIDADQYSAIFSANGGAWVEGESSVATKTVSTYDLPGDPVGTAKPADPTRTGYSFKGWATSSTGTTAADALNNNQLRYSSDPTNPNMYYAIWELDNTTVKFDPKDGTTATSQTGAPGGSATAPTGYTAGTTVKTISGTSYKFAGWSETEVSPGATATTTTTFTFPNSGTKTYYGVWTEQTTITYNVNWPTTTGTIGPAPSAPGANTGDKGRTIDTTATALQLSDSNGQYTFGGWYKEAACTNAAGSGYKADATATLYAKWTPVTHKVTYAAGATSGVTGMPTPNPVTDILHATSHTISTTEPTRTGYTFTGWTSDVSGDTNNYKKDGTGNKSAITVNADVTLTAQWSTNQYTVTFNPNSGTWSAGTGNKTTAGAYVDKVTTPTETISRTGYTFKEWNTVADGSGDKLDTASDTYGAKSGTTYYAVWTENDVTVTFHTENGTWGSSYGGAGVQGTSNDYAMKGKYTATLTAPTNADISRTGYTFGGWAESSGGSAVTVPSTFGAAKADYYAIWSIGAKTVTVKITKDGSDASGVSVKMNGTTKNTGSDGVATFSVTPAAAGSNYDIEVDGDKVDTVTITPTTTDTDYTYDYFTIGVTTDGNGTATVKTTSNTSPTIGVKTATAASTTYSASIVVLDGEALTWAYGTANDDYKADKWTGKTNASDITDETAASGKTHEATYTKKLGSIVVNAKKDAATTDYNFPNGTVITLVPTGVALGADTTKEKTKTVSDATTKSVTFSNLEHDSASGWDIYVGSTKIADGDNVKVTGNDGSSVSKNAMYYTAEVKTGGNGDASVTDGTNTAATDYAAATAVTTNSIVVLEQTKVTWTVGTPKTDYVFSNWDGNSANGATAFQNVSVTAKTSHTANFNKEFYTVELVVNLDKVAQATADIGSAKDIKSITVTRKSGTADSATHTFTETDTTNHIWSVSGLKNGTTYTVSVTTVTGTYVVKDVTTDAVGANRLVANYYTLKVADGAHGNDTNKPYITSAGTTKAVVPAGTELTINGNPDAGYTVTGWVEDDGSTAINSNVGSSASITKFTFASSVTGTTPYTIEPTMTFATTIVPKRGTDVHDATSVAVKTGSTTKSATKDSTTKKWSVDGLTPGSTYTVVVNGFESSVTFNKGKANGEVDVEMYEIKTVKDPATSDGTAYVNLGDSASGTATAVYVPKGASTATSGAAQVSVKAAAGTDYRLRNGESVKAWTGLGTAADTDTATTKVTFSNIQDDITATAHFMLQRVVDVTMDASTKGTSTLTQPVVSAGSVGTVSGGNYPGNKVDDGGNITVDTTPQNGLQLDYWDISGGTFEVYADAAALAAGTQLANNGTTGRYKASGNSLVVKPTGTEKVTVKAVYREGLYDVTIAVKLDNDVYTGRTVELKSKKTGGTNYTLTETGTNTGVFTGQVLAATYDVYVDGEKTGTTKDAEKDVTVSYSVPTVSETVYYYTVDLVRAPSSITDSDMVFVDHNGSVRATDRVTSIVMLAKTSSYSTSVAATLNNYSTAATTHYAFKSWSVAPATNGGSMTSATSAATSYNLPKQSDLTGNTNITKTKHITLTAEWEQNYKVTLAPPVITDTSTALGDHVTVKFGGTSKDSSNPLADRSVWVKAGSEMAITDLALKNNANNYIFAKWTQDQTGATAGAFDATAGATTADTKFTPTADTVLTANYWRKPTLTAIDSYHQNFATGTKVDPNSKWGDATNKKTNNTLPVYTWTKNQATLAATDEIQISKDGGTTWETLTTGTAAEVAADNTIAVKREVNATTGNVTYTFQEKYLMSLVVPMGDTCKTFSIRVQSNTPDTTTTNAAATPLTAKLEIAVNPDPLKRVDIQAKTAAGDLTVTASVESASGRDQVEYWTHTPTTIDKDNKLTYTWYYGPSKPTQGAYSSASAANNATNITNAKANVTGTEITGVTGPTVDVKDPKYKGMYIYAVVAASNTGYGAAITNSIAVDYDATVTVKKDGSSVSAATGYTVYLLEKKDGNADGYATMPTGVKTTSWNSEKKYFETTNSALTGGVTYDVYVNKVEGDTTYYVKTGQTVSPTSQSATVNFYSVNAVATDLKHAKDNAGADVGEDFSGTASAPTTAFTTTGAGANTITVGDTKGVFTGSKVTAAASKAWAQDYWWNWQSNTTGNAFTSYGAEHKTSGNTGKEYTISAKTYIGGQMEQKTYTVKGNVWALGNNTNAGVKNPLLTANGHNFSGTWAGNGKHKGVVTFTVPKSGVAGALDSKNYVISATPFDGTETGLGTVQVTTLEKYAQYIDVAAASTNDAAVNAKAALTNDTIAQITADNNGAFTIVVTASNWTLRVQDNDATKAVDQSAAHTTAVKAANGVTKVDNANTTTTWTKTFANYASDQKVYNVTVSNPGNTDLKVSLVVKKTVGSTTTTVYDGSATVTSDSANSVAFTDLTKDANSFDLAAKTDTATASKTFQVTLPDDLDNNDDVTYSFEFTSKDKNDASIYGPSITYNLKLVIDPIPVKSVDIKPNAGGTFSADNLVFDATSAPLDAASGVTLTTTNDLTYQWYVGTQPTVNATTGAVSGTKATGSGNATATYTPVTADGGKTLWLVVSGKNNASKYAMNSVAAPYSAKVTIMEDTTATTSYGDYKVYLVPTTVTNPSFATGSMTAGIVEATHKTTDAQGVFTTGADLVNGTSYNVWTNVVKGSTAEYKNNGALGNPTDGVASKTVTYYSVTVNETTYDNTYIGLTGAAFFGTSGGTVATTSATGNAGITATAAAGATATPVTSGGWVVSGTEVTFTHDAWNKDYTLAWTGADKQGTDEPTTTGSTAKTTVNANKTVDAELTLNLYEIKAHVVGKGDVKEITLTGTDLSFTSITAHDGLLNGTGGNSGTIQQDQSVTFKVPEGTYSVTGTPASGTTLEGYRKPHKEGDLTNHTGPSDSFDVTTTDDTSFDVVVSATGKAMTVTDNATTLDSTTATGTGTARYINAAVQSATVEQTIKLPYGYSASTLTLTVSNTSPDGGDIFQVKMNDPTLDASGKITVTGPGTSDIQLDGTADMALNATTPVTINIATGLEVGDYDSELSFAYNAVSNDTTNRPELTYKLRITVVPTKFTAVTVSGQDASGNVALGDDLSFATYTTEDVNDWTNGKNLAADEYTYQWYHGPANKTATESWSAGTATVTDATAITGATGATLAASEIAKYPGEHIYLVISAVKDKNVIEAAISAPVTTGFQPVVKVSVDGALQSDGTGYTATIDDGTTTWNTVWDATAGGFVPVGADGTTKVSLDATTSYTAKVSRAKGDATLVALDDKLSNTSTANTVTAPYFTVNAVDTKAFAYRSDVGEDFNDNGTDKLTGPAVSFTLGGADLDDGTPVLSGQSVTAKTDTWDQDYKLTWYTKMDATATVPTRDTSYEGATPAMTARGGKVDSTSASGTGYTVTSVTNKLYVGGRLDQNTYIINVTISGTGSVASVATTQNADSTVAFTGTNDDKNGNSLFDQGDTMKFTVVASDYDIAATQGAGTNIVSVKWETDTAVTGNKLTKKNVAKNPAKDPYSVVINIESANLNLTVSDDKTTPNKASAGIGEAKGVTNSEVRYFSGIPANDKLDLSLSNSGNKPLDTTMTVYHFDKVGSIPAYADATKWGTSATGYLASAPATTGDLADTLFQNEGRQVITVTGVMADGTTVAAKAGSDASNPAVPAGTITIGPGAYNKDDGVYVFRFVGDDKDATTDNPVVYYVLDLTIQPLPITGVTTDTPTTAPGKGDKVQLKGATDGTTGGFNNVMVDPDGTATGTAAPVAADTVADPALVDGADVKYQWVWSATSMTSTAVKGLLKVDATSGAISSTDTSKVKLLDNNNGANTKQYTVQDADMDGYLYLVAYAPGASVNASDLAVSPAIKTKRTVGVQITLDGNASTNIQPTANYDDPGYVIYLVEDGKTFNATNAATGTDGTWATTWSKDSNKMYKAAIDVDNVTYRVYAPSYKGSTNYVDTGLTLGKQTSGDPVTKVQVPYFSVKHTTNLTVTNTHDGFSPYLPSSNTTTKADNQVQGALSVAVSDDRNSTAYTKGTVLTTDNVPVLKDMNVKVTVDATKTSNNTTGVKNTWSDAQPYHTLSANIDANSTNWTGTATGAGIAYAATITGADIKVDAAKNFAAKLEQVLFDVTFQVKDITPAGTTPAGYHPGVTEVVLQTDGTKEPNAESKSFDGIISNGADGEKGTHGATVTFQKVPAGHLEIDVKDTQGRTNVNGFTWRASDADADTVYFPGNIVEVTALNDAGEDLNQHAAGNNNIIQVEYSSNAVRWFDNFNTADGSLLKEADGTTDKFVQSPGFKKVDNTGGPYLALTEGYSAANGDVLTYTVQVKNTGANPLADFQISPTNTNLQHTLATAKIYATDGTVKIASQDVLASGFSLDPNEIVEFQVTIPAKQASNSNYATTFTVTSSNPDPVAGNSYGPSYQVKPVIELKPGNATVIYGNDHFEATPVDVTPANKNDGTWDNAVYTTTFAYELVQLDGANDATILADLNAKLGLSLTTLAAKPEWLSFDTTTGAVTFDNAKRATGVNVQVKDSADIDHYIANDVDNELVLYIKAVDQKNPNDVYYTTYTVNVEPGQLKIVGDKFTPGNPIDGQKLDKSAFTYDQVDNQMDEAVVTAAAIAGKNTAEGNTAAKDGKVDVDGVHTAEWSVSDDKYVLGDHGYQFTVTYKPDTAAEKWNYKPATVTKHITANKPDMDLLFSDKLGKSSIETDPAAELKIGRAPDDGYSPIKTDNQPYAPAEMDKNNKTYRKGEYIVYLDTEPKYEVTLTGIGDIYNVEVESELIGFKVVGTDLSFANDEIHSDVKTFTLELAPMPGTTNQWVGEHIARYTVTGNSRADGTGDSVKATYELVLTVQPKVIAEAHVTDLTDPTPGAKPDTTVTVTAKDPEGEDIKPNTPDKHGNTPIKPTVTWTEGGKPVDPTKDFEDGKDYTVTVELPADPNYIYEDYTPEEPNYTAGDEGPDPTYSEPEVTHKVEEGDSEQVTITKTTPLPKKSYLMFDDVKTGGQTSDPAKRDAEVNLVRQPITVIKGQKLGVYTINLGAYDETVTEVFVTETGKDLPAGATWSLTSSPDSVGDLYNVKPDTNGDKKVYTLDLSGVDTSTLTTGHTYTLELKAKGFDPYGADVFATYKMSIVVQPAPVPVLKFDDERLSAGSSNDRNPAKLGPEENVERGVITVTQGDQLGRYTVKLDAYGNTASDVYLELKTNITTGDKIYQLMDDTTLMKLDPSKHLTLNQANTALKPWVFDLDLSSVDTSEPGEYILTLTARGKDLNNGGANLAPATYTLTIRINPKPSGGGSSGGSPACPNQVTYLLGLYGTTKDSTMEMVSNGKVKAVPNVTALEGYKFLGWSLVGPTGKIEQDAKRAVVDPTTMSITGDTVFYAVYQPVYKVPEPPLHKHYVIGYPNGKFGPADNITRGSVATIIARAVLPNFVEGADYGNPGRYSDVVGHWSESAIAYCSKYGVFNGYTDGTFRPDQPITRQELALVVARLNGVQTGGTAPFTDIGDAGSWAADGIYTAYINGWVNGYNDGSFKPLNPIRRDETVKIFNAYLHRGVNAEGLSELTEYVHTGVASNNTGNGTTEYMTWPDVPKDHWAYYEIIEAANDHEFKVDSTLPIGYAVPEQWTKSWIDERWRYHDDANDGGSSAVVSDSTAD